MKQLSINKKTLFRFAKLFVLIVSLPLFVYLTQIVVKYFSKADIPPVYAYVLPSSQNIPPDGVFKLTLDLSTNTVSFIRVSIDFDKTKLNINDITYNKNLPVMLVDSSSIEEANLQGKIFVVLAVAPDKNLLTGSFDMFYFNASSLVADVVSTQITVNTSDTQIVASTGGVLLVEGQSSRVNLNTVPSPTVISTPILTATITPSLTPTAYPTSTLTSTPTPIPTVLVMRCFDLGGVCRTKCTAGQTKVDGYCSSGVCCK